MGVTKVSGRSSLYQDDRKWVWKFALRIFAIISALGGIGCVAWASSENWNPRYFDDYGAHLLVPYDLIPLGFSLIWNIANIAVLLARKRAIHPGANVGCDLTIWCTFFPMVLFVTFAAITTASEYYTAPVQYRLQMSAVKYAGGAISFVLLLFHFAFFVSACRYTHERRREELFRRVKQAVKEEMEMESYVPRPPAPQRIQTESHVPHPPIPQITENGKPIPMTSEAKPAGPAGDHPLPLSVPRTEGVHNPAPLNIISNSWAQDGGEV